MAAAMKSWVNKCLGSDDPLLWESNLKRHVSGEYSIAVVQANATIEDQSQVLATPSSTLVGVFDGHGGPDAARFVNANLFTNINKYANERGGVSGEVIRKGFAATEEQFFRVVKQRIGSKPEMASVGTCCLVGAISGDSLFVANLGDSRAVLGRRCIDSKRVVAERLSRDHNVSVEDVRKEVEALHPDDKHIVMFIRGVWRIKGIIQVSRSIGDAYLKKPEIGYEPTVYKMGFYVPIKRPVISSDPSILFRKLKPQDMFLIFASDGLWEHLTDDEAVEIVATHSRSGISRRLITVALKRAASKMEMKYSELKKLDKGVRRNLHDDITVVVIYLDHHRHNYFADTVSPVDVFPLIEGHEYEDERY